MITIGNSLLKGKSLGLDLPASATWLVYYDGKSWASPGTILQRNDNGTIPFGSGMTVVIRQLRWVSELIL